VTAARTQGEVERVASELRREGAQAFPYAGDLTQEATVRALGDFAREKLGAVDLLVNNAGGSSSAPLHRVTLEEWNRVLAVNATTTFLCSREFAPAMVARGMGRIVNVASIAGLEGARYVTAYCAAKHAMVGFTRALSAELAGSGVTANALCPAYVDTPMMARTLDNVRARTGKSAEEALAAVLATTGQDRLLAPEEVASAVLELCLEAASQTTGEAIVMRPVASPR
jgi:NAD(P)-dependent dehydrogenase (short-subunit alcohol dehydrogenase family)